MRRLLTTLTAFVLLVFTACGGDELSSDISAYHGALSPTLGQNMALAQQFLEITGLLKDKQLTNEDVVSRFEERIIPQADGLKADVAAIQPSTSQLQELHSQLVAAWSERADAYHQMSDAYKANDTQAFQAAFDRNLQAKLAEEQYFNQINALMGTYGYHLDQFQ